VLATLSLLAQATLFAHVVAGAFDGSSLSDLLPPLALLSAVIVLRSLLAFAFESTGRRAGAQAMSGLRLALVERRLRGNPLAADGAEAAEVATAAVQGVDALEVYFARYLPQVVLAVLVPVVVLAWTAAVDRTSAVIMVATLPLIPVFMVLIGRATQVRTRERWRALARLSTHFLDVVRGLPTLRAFNRAEAQTERIEAASEAFRATTMEVLRVSFLSGAVLELMATIATALVAVTLGIRLVDGAVGFEAALVVLLLTPELYAPLRSLAAQYHASAEGLGAAERILGLLGEAARRPGGEEDVPERWDAVRLEVVTVRYPGRTDPALDRFDLELRRGETVALVGPSGAGKSTVAALLLAMRAPDSGRVTVGGRDLSEFDAALWRSQVAWLPQHPTIVRGTIGENIALGDPGASCSRIAAAARLAGAEEFVRELRLGFDTRVGEGGRPLSAGEARRVALARALLREAALVVLDEPTANLDAESAWRVADAIRSVAPGRAVLLIEHRMDVATGLADRVVHMGAWRPAPAGRELVGSVP
jgi:thiol reductant ABC exporter CydD subunit